MRFLYSAVIICLLAAGICRAEDKSLVGCWKFDEGQGEVASDSSGNNNDGAIHGSAWVRTGMFGSALIFDREESYVQIPKSQVLEKTFQSEGTLEMWFRPSSDFNDYQNHFLFIAGHLRWIYKDWVGNLLAWRMFGVGGSKAMTWDTGRWYFLAITWKGIGTPEAETGFYVDGEGNIEKNSKTSVSQIADNIFIGGASGRKDGCDGMIDEIKIYNRALSAEEIKKEYHLHSPEKSLAGQITIEPIISLGGIKQGENKLDVKVNNKNRGESVIDAEVKLKGSDGNISKTLFPSVRIKPGLNTISLNYSINLPSEGNKHHFAVTILDPERNLVLDRFSENKFVPPLMECSMDRFIADTPVHCPGLPPLGFIDRFVTKRRIPLPLMVKVRAGENELVNMALTVKLDGKLIKQLDRLSAQETDLSLNVSKAAVGAHLVEVFLCDKGGEKLAKASQTFTKLPQEQNFVLYAVKPITNVKILPDTPIPCDIAEVSNELTIIASPGEYEPVSFALHAVQDISDLQLTPTPLTGKAGRIDPANVDIRVVKCWYVSGEKDTMNRDMKVFTPELLLKDDSLVKVDGEYRENYLKLTHGKGTPVERKEYVCISVSESRGLGAKGSLSIEEFPVYDSPALLPVDIPKGMNKQFWVTLKAPEDAVAGIYAGNIELRVKGGLVGSIKLKLRVLPFKLAQPYPISSVYYKGVLDPAGNGKISSVKSELQFTKEMENLFAHGVTAPQIYTPFRNFDERILGKTLEIRNRAGISNQSLYVFGLAGSNRQASAADWLIGNPSTSNELECLKHDIKKFIDFCRPYGVKEVYFYGIDEARGDVLESQRPAWKAVHESGGKIFVAGYRGNNFAIAGDLQDLLICAGSPSREEAKRWHGMGRQIVCYANPQAGVEEPETYRRNFGLLLWQNDYDGAMNHLYQSGSVGYNIWNDFHEKGGFRRENFTYPTADGVVDTTEWEGHREGVKDIKYVNTLLQALKKAKKSNQEDRKDIISSAEDYLNKLKEKDLGKIDLDIVRLEIIGHILKLEGEIK